MVDFILSFTYTNHVDSSFPFRFVLSLTWNCYPMREFNFFSIAQRFVLKDYGSNHIDLRIPDTNYEVIADSSSISCMNFLILSTF